MDPTPQILHLNIGELIVSREPAVVSTVLGSCVSVCLFSKNQKIGGMIHYALAHTLHSSDEDWLRYGNEAIRTLIEEIKKLTGGNIHGFTAKIVGGAATGIAGENNGIGTENIDLARQMLSEFGIPIVSESIGGKHGRRVLFHIPSGRLQVAVMNQAWRASFADKKRGDTTQIQAPFRSSTSPRKVLVVDDSKTIRDLLRKVLQEDSDLQVIGEATNPLEADALLKTLRPDVITLDIHMPHMTGVEWLEKLIPRNPIPVVMISSLQLQEGNEVFRALELGAVDYLQKPTFSDLKDMGPLIREKIKSASYAHVLRHETPMAQSSFSWDLDLKKVLAIGASTGGTEAIKSVLLSLPSLIPPTVVVQHIPAVFSKAFSDRLNELCSFEVKEAEDGDELRASRVLIAPGGKQLSVHRKPTGLFVRVTDDPPVNRHKPSVDYLFHSVASCIGDQALGVILTGMGADGAKGLLAMRQRGAHTIAQDEPSCVVYGMPKAATEMGAVSEVASLKLIPRAILKKLSRAKLGKAS